MRQERWRGGELTLRCARCDRYLPPGGFIPNGRMRHGVSSWCRDCASTATRQWRADNLDAINAARRDAYAAAKGPGGQVRPYSRSGRNTPRPVGALT